MGHKSSFFLTLRLFGIFTELDTTTFVPTSATYLSSSITRRVEAT